MGVAARKTGERVAKRKVKWGVLGAASIAVRKVIPGMQQGEYCDVAAIASRDLAKARAAATTLKIGKAYGSYEELLADPEIEAIYNPLPNHLHVPWSIKAMEAGKHVLCEKPIALHAAEAKTLLPVRDRAGVKIGEAFMVRTHPQWLRTRELIRQGRIGALRASVGVFSYFKRDAKNEKLPKYSQSNISSGANYGYWSRIFTLQRKCKQHLAHKTHNGQRSGHNPVQCCGWQCEAFSWKRSGQEPPGVEGAAWSDGGCGNWGSPRWPRACGCVVREAMGAYKR